MRRPANPVPPPAETMDGLKSGIVPDLPIPDSLGDDLLVGAAAIAKFVFGPNAHARRAHTAMASRRNTLPHFHVGGRLYARKSVIIQWIADQERRKLRGR